MNGFLIRHQRSIKWLLWLLLLLPMGWIADEAFSMPAQANPIEFMTLQTGIWALRVLMMCLLITPLRRLSGWLALLRFRRTLGLIAFSYAALHVLVYALFDHQLSLASIAEDIIKRKYVLAGAVAFVILLAMAMTSNQLSIKALGAKLWQRIHRFVYVASVAVCVHFIWQTKADFREPFIYTAIVLGLLALRLPAIAKALTKELTKAAERDKK